MTSLRDWITDDGESNLIPDLEGLYVAMELDHNAVSVKGSNVFPITYSLIANVRHCLSRKLYIAYQ